eukprot:CAMPEP_0181519284 /NCGR_PEP_ID=MMETSP1110-20121109/65706_1 /TAXON_ID=174948 /ORGANISM="Symbiodinium sp., Strain CCMP421" /LENGTH=1087 /DNA_ID=CAMNT_0023649719 /DNA_START=30 /DNA_END=3294 /DNA_ORIENTATION=+
MACPELEGCRFPHQDGLFCKGFLGLVSETENVSALDGLAAQSLAGLPSFLPESCARALRSFTCQEIVPGCAHGKSLPICRSVCQAARERCGTLVLAMMPASAQQRLDCDAFVDGSWPECAERDETSDCFASSCSSGSYSLQDRPCGFCNGNEFTQLAMDVCGVCNGDNASCTCDGLSVGVLDACGQCEGAATACRYLESDPRMVGFLCTACCVLVLVAAMLLIVRKRLCKHPRKCGSIPGPAVGKAVSTVAQYVADVQSGCFCSTGRLVARRPWCIIAAALLLAATCGSGLLWLQVDEDVVEIWVPFQAESVLNRDRLQALQQSVSVLLVSRSLGFSSKESLLQALAVHNTLVDIVINSTAGKRSLLGACLAPTACYDKDGGLLAGPDSILSPLQLWGFGEGALESDPDPVQKLKSAVEGTSFEAASLGQLLAWDEDREPMKQHIEQWETAARHVAVTAEDRSPAWSVHVFSQRGLADDLEDAVDSDVNSIVLGYCLMSVYVSAFIGRHVDLQRGRGLMATAAMLSVGLATLTAFGLCAAIGVRYNATVSIAIFVIMGVGVDDSFLIVRTLEEGDDAEGPGTEERIAKALAKAGPSVLLSSTTNILAFALGAGTPMPALISFCIYTSVGMATDFAFQVTFFVAMLALDERRRRCSPSCSIIPEFCRVGRIHSCGWKGLLEALSKSLTSSAWLRSAVLLLWLTLMTASTVVAFDLKVGLEPQELVPASSMTAAYFRQLAVLPSEAEFPEILVQHQEIADPALDLGVAPLEDASTQEGLLHLYDSLIASTDVIDSFGSLWLKTFKEAERERGSPPGWNSVSLTGKLESFMNSSEGRSLERAGAFVRTAASSGSLLATRIRLLSKDYKPWKMLSLRATVSEANLRLEKAAFVYSPSDVYREQDAVLIQNTTASLLFMLIAVLAAVFVLSFNFAMMAALTLALYSCCVHMFGWMVLTGLQLNSLSVIPLLLSVGLCVDYCAHIAHSFWHMSGSSKSRALAALQGRGPAVLHAGISTGLSQMPLAFSQSAVFTTFFIMMTGMVLVGLFHALCVLPVCLSFLPDTEGDKDCCVAGSATPPAKIGISDGGHPPL